MQAINCKAYTGVAVTTTQLPGIHSAISTQFVRRIQAPGSFTVNIKMSAKSRKQWAQVFKQFDKTFGKVSNKMYSKYWVHAEQLDGFIAAKVIEEVSKLKGHTPVSHNVQEVYEKDKGLFDKVLDRIHQTYGKGPHDIDGKLIAVGDSIIIANGRNLIFGNVVEVTTSKVKVGIVRSTYNPKPTKVRNRTYMFPERMKVL